MLVGYMRVSSTNDRQNTDLQQDALLKAGVDRRQLFMDKMSGLKDARPGLDKALAYLTPGDTLVVWKLDRLGRSLAQLLRIVTDLGTRGVGFQSLTEHMDTTTAQGKLLFSMFGALAEYERALTQERIKAGLEAAALRGRKGGRPEVIGHEQLTTIRAELARGVSKAAVCRIFRLKRTTLYDALARYPDTPHD